MPDTVATETGQSTSRIETAWRVAPSVLRAIAEGGWLTVVYAAGAVGFERLQPALGPIEFGLFVGVGMLIALYARRQPQMGPLILIVALVAAGACGWLSSPQARSALSVDPVGALKVHGIGWLAAAAVARGVYIGRGPIAAHQFERLLGLGLSALAIIWAITAIVTPPSMWSSFAVVAFWGTIALIASALMGLGFNRLETLQVGRSDSRVRRQWRLLTLASALGVAPLAIPFALLSGIPLVAMVGPITWPLQALVSLLAIPVGLIAGWLIDFLRQFADLFPEGAEQVGGGQINTAEDIPAGLTSNIADLIGIGIVVLALLLLAYLAAELVGWLLSRRSEEPNEQDATADGLERDIVVPTRTERPQTVVLRRRPRRAPTDVVTAYVSAIGELDGHPTFARAEAETPAEHAIRLRKEQMPGATDLARLAAGYQLARYGERRITPLENARAVSRFQRLRRILGTSTA